MTGLSPERVEITNQIDKIRNFIGYWKTKDRNRGKTALTALEYAEYSLIQYLKNTEANNVADKND